MITDTPSPRDADASKNMTRMSTHHHTTDIPNYSQTCSDKGCQATDPEVDKQQALLVIGITYTAYICVADARGFIHFQTFHLKNTILYTFRGFRAAGIGLVLSAKVQGPDPVKVNSRTLPSHLKLIILL